MSLLNKLTITGKKEKMNTRNTKWAKFSCVGKETKFITKLFKSTALKIAFVTQNTNGKLLPKQNNHHKNKFEKCGVYHLTCLYCNKKYIGQNRRPFHIRFI
jgi:hypothetical protein